MDDWKEENNGFCSIYNYFLLFRFYFNIFMNEPTQKKDELKPEDYSCIEEYFLDCCRFG